MDPRQARTTEALRSAILGLAAAKPIDDVSVAEVARAASITRETFYRHHASPVDLLAAVLGAELEAMVVANAALPATTGGAESVFAQPERALVEHVVEHAAIYRNALTPHLTSRLRDVLTDSIQLQLLAHLRRHPQIAPTVRGAQADDRARAMFASYAASGTVGAIETWLTTGALDDTDGAAQTILAASPEWWLGMNGDGA
jgi:AcrR family transcriptional regulator